MTSVAPEFMPVDASSTIAVVKKKPAPSTKYLRNEAGLYVCPHCGETKARQNTMYYHMKKHAGVLDYPCPEPGCGKAFVQKSALDQHCRQAHPAIACPEAWGCPCCDHTSTVKANLVIHIGRKHGARWIPVVGADAGTEVFCPSCSKELASSTAYYYHAVKCFGVPYEPVLLSGCDGRDGDKGGGSAAASKAASVCSDPE
jgi:hypothetical protein